MHHVGGSVSISRFSVTCPLKTRTPNMRPNRVDLPLKSGPINCGVPSCFEPAPKTGQLGSDFGSRDWVKCIQD